MKLPKPTQPFNILSEDKKLKAFYESQNHLSEVTNTLNVRSWETTAVEFKDMPGTYFLKSSDGMKLFAITLNVTEIT